MPNIYEGKISAEGKKFALVVSRFNDFVGDRLLAGAIDALSRHGAGDKDIDIVKVPGSFEIPLMAKKMVEKNCLFDLCRMACLYFIFIY
jgi:6,7-dimethyl-8-ribityllumazine synthase